MYLYVLINSHYGIISSDKPSRRRQCCHEIQQEPPRICEYLGFLRPYAECSYLNDKTMPFGPDSTPQDAHSFVAVSGTRFTAVRPPLTNIRPFTIGQRSTATASLIIHHYLSEPFHTHHCRCSDFRTICRICQDSTLHFQLLGFFVADNPDIAFSKSSCSSLST